MASSLQERRLVERRDAAERRIRRGDLAAVDEYNELSEQLAGLRRRPYGGPSMMRPCPVVIVVMGRDGVRLFPAELVPPELRPANFNPATGTYNIEEDQTA